MPKDLPPDVPRPREGQGRGREHDKQGACFTRVEAFARALSFSCTEVGVRYLRMVLD